MRSGGILRLKPVIDKHVPLPPLDRHATAKVQPNLLFQEGLNLTVAHLGDMFRQENRRVTVDAVPNPMLHQNRNSVETLVVGGENASVIFDVAVKKALVILVVGGVHSSVYDETEGQDANPIRPGAKAAAVAVM